MIRLHNAHLPVFAITHEGKSGKNNEDRYAVSAFQLGEEDPTPAVFAVLADGIGGHRAGEVAAEMAVEIISRQVAASDARSPLETLTAAIHFASQQISAAAHVDDNQSGMGSTCACAWVINNRLYTATVGDSRIYLLRGGSINQLSTDHTWIQEALQRGILTPEQARNHPNQHIIRRYLGSPIPPVVDNRMQISTQTPASEEHQGLSLLPGDRLLLCSDGLTDLVRDAEILEKVSNLKPNAALHALVGLANQRGGYDNITIVLLHAPQKAFDERPAKPLWGGWKVLGIIILLGLLAALIWGSTVLVNTITRVEKPTPTATVFIVPSPLVTLPPASLPSASVTPPAVLRSATPPPPSPTALPPTPQGATITPWPTHTPKP